MPSYILLKWHIFIRSFNTYPLPNMYHPYVRNKWNSFIRAAQFASKIKIMWHRWWQRGDAVVMVGGADGDGSNVTSAVRTCIHYPINSHLAIIHQLNGVCTTTNADMLYLFLARHIMPHTHRTFSPVQPFSSAYKVSSTHYTYMNCAMYGIWMDTWIDTRVFHFLCSVIMCMRTLYRCQR